MLLLLSPAKSLDYHSPLAEVPHSEPLFVKQSARLIASLRRKRSAQVAELMDLSAALADLNVARYKAWRQKSTPANSRAAVLAFDGAVYAGLAARTLDTGDLAWAQDHPARGHTEAAGSVPGRGLCPGRDSVQPRPSGFSPQNPHLST